MLHSLTREQTAPSMSACRHMSWSSRGFVNQLSAGVYENLDLPSADQIRSALIRVYEVQPENRVFYRIRTEPKPAWLPVGPSELDAYCEQVVRDVGEEPGVGPSAAAEAAMRVSLDGLPFRIDTSPSRFSITLDHSTGDGRFLTWLIAAIILTGRDGDVAHLRQPAGVRLPLARALANFYGRDPRRVWRTLRQPRLAPTFFPPSPGEHLGEVGVVTDSTSLGSLDELRRWRNAEQPEAALSGLVTAGLARSLASAGIALASSGVTIILDARRYLPPNTAVNGVFVSNAYLEPEDVFDPTSVSRDLFEAIESGRPLATLARDNLRKVLSDSSAAPEARPSRPTARLTVSHVQRPLPYEALPWRGGAAHACIAGAAEPGGSIGLSVVVTELAGRLHLSAIFRKNALPRPAIVRALDGLCRDPIGVLS